MAVPHPSPPFSDLTYYPISRWIRGTRGEKTIVESRRVLLVWNPGKKVPIYAFPAEDVSVDSDDGSVPMQIRRFDDADLSGYVTIPWDALDHWYEEDEEVFVHPRDPFVRIDALRSSRHVQVKRDGHVLAESDAPILLFETGLPTRYYLPESDFDTSVLPTRYYLPESDFDTSVLTESALQTGCPYKGFASYRDVVLDGRRHPNLLWYYPSPFSEVAAVQGHIAPYSERVDLIVDGVLQERPAGPLGKRAEQPKRAA
jgi:uncharacterized protein (DUF427 family)